MTMNGFAEAIKKADFPKNLSIKHWERYLGRNLLEEEHVLFNNAKIENACKISGIKMNEYFKTIGLYAPYLTDPSGNCLFESLKHYGFFDDEDEFRKNLSFLMYMFKDVKLFGDDYTIKEMVTLYNDIYGVQTSKDNNIYKYTHTFACIDLWNNASWSRLNTNLVLMLISYFYNVRFHVYKFDTQRLRCDKFPIIDVSKEENSLDVYLGLQNEDHYIPLELCVGNEKEKEHPKLKTENAKIEFFKWGLKKAELRKQMLEKHKKTE